MRTSRVVACVGVFLVVFGAFLILAPGRIPDRTIGVVDDLVFVVLTPLGVLACVSAARATRGRRRAAWVTMSLAMVAWALGDALWVYYDDIIERAPFPSPADVPYLSYSVLAAVALLLFPTRRSALSVARPILDGVIVAGSLFMVSWLTVLGPIYRADGMTREETVVSLAYLLAAVVLLTVAAVVLARTSAGHRLPMAVLTLGLALSAVASGFFSYLWPQAEYGSGNLLDLGWAASASLVVVAAAIDRDADRRGGDAEDPEEGWASVLLPYLPLMLAAVIAALSGQRTPLDGPVPVVGVAVLAAVLARQFLADRDNRRLLNTVKDQASHDPLTGLANRILLDDRLRRLLRAGAPLGVLALDLDGFKQVNDTLGHGAGDELLYEVGQRLQRCVRATDMVVRLGGDEFAVLIEGTAEHVRDIADRVASGFGEPFTIAGRPIPLTTSLGVAVAARGHSGLSADTILSQADSAMYAAKRSSEARQSGAPAGNSVSEIELMQ